MTEPKKNTHKIIFCYDLLRMYVGFALCLKGISFFLDNTTLLAFMEQGQILFMQTLISHYIILAHVVGGLLLCVGLLTQIAAFVQIPILLGAILFIHLGEGLFTSAQTLELVLLTGVLVLLFTITGSGPLSVDDKLNL